MAGENACLGTSYTFTRARSRPTFHNMMTPTSKSDDSETDVSQKKMKIQKKPHIVISQNWTRSSEVTRVAVVP